MAQNALELGLRYAKERIQFAKPLHSFPLDAILRNLVASTLGNIIGGTLLVAGVYWVAYLRKGRG